MKLPLIFSALLLLPSLARAQATQPTSQPAYDNRPIVADFCDGVYRATANQTPAQLQAALLAHADAVVAVEDAMQAQGSITWNADGLGWDGKSPQWPLCYGGDPARVFSSRVTPPILKSYFQRLAKHGQAVGILARAERIVYQPAAATGNDWRYGAPSNYGDNLFMEVAACNAAFGVMPKLIYVDNPWKQGNNDRLTTNDLQDGCSSLAAQGCKFFIEGVEAPPSAIMPKSAPWTQQQYAGFYLDPNAGYRLPPIPIYPGATDERGVVWKDRGITADMVPTLVQFVKLKGTIMVEGVDPQVVSIYAAGSGP